MNMPSKICSECGVLKTLDNFYACKRRAHKDSRETICKNCHRSYDKSKEKENIRRYKKDPEFREHLKEKRNKATKKWAKTESGRLYRRKYRNREYVKIKDKEIMRKWRSSKKGKKWVNEYQINKRKNNTGYRIRCRLTIGINKAVKGIKKTWRTMSLIGCSIEELKKHLQKTAVANGYDSFNINDYSSQEYHIDHIKPCASFDLTQLEQLAQCFHYTNLQILKASVNISKRAKLNWSISNSDND